MIISVFVVLKSDSSAQINVETAGRHKEGEVNTLETGSVYTGTERCKKIEIEADTY